MMFSVQQKRDISDAVQKILRATNHAELPTTGEITFTLKVAGAESWSWAEIHNNGAVGDPGVNPHNELMASKTEEEGRTIIEEATALAGDARVHPDEMMQEAMKQQLSNLTQRVFKAEAIIIDYNKRLNALEDFLKEIMEDNLIAHHDAKLRELGNDGVTLSEDNKSLHTRINSLETAIRQLNSPLVDGDG